MTSVRELPCKFSGEIGIDEHVEEPKAWLSHFSKVARVNGWKTDAEKVADVGIALIGEAERWYDINVKWIEDEETSWKLF